MTKPVALFALAWALFVLAVSAPAALAAALPETLARRPWLDHAVTKTVLVALAFALMAASRRPLADHGFRRASDPRWLRSAMRGGLLGAVTTAALILAPTEGMTWIRDLGVGGIVLWIWLHSTVTEEVFVRGWFQSAIPGPRATLWSAALFGSMHLLILRQGADWITVGIIVPATTLLGLLCAQDRERSGSLGPPIITHCAFNVGGFLAGVAITIAVAVATGKPPAP